MGLGTGLAETDGFPVGDDGSLGEGPAGALHPATATARPSSATLQRPAIRSSTPPRYPLTGADAPTPR